MNAASAGDRDRTLPLDTSSAPLSLKARETASLSLKHIFEQQLQQQQRSSLIIAQCTNEDDRDVHIGNACQSMPMTAPADPDLDLRLAPPSTSYTIINNHGEPSLQGGGQLTIFYAGTVYVYQDVPTDKAQAILVLASGNAGDSYQANYISNNAAEARIKSKSPTPPLQTSDVAAVPAKRATKAVRRSQADLPLARKASFTHFLEKRKERLEEKNMVANKHIVEPPQKRPCSTSSTHQS